MKMKDLAKAIVDCQDEKFVNKIDKEINKLLQLRFICNVVELVDSVEHEIKPFENPDQNFGKVFKYELGSVDTYPANMGIKYKIGKQESSVSLFSPNLDFFVRGYETLKKEKSKKEIIIDHSFNERLIADIIGEKLFEEYYNLIEENKYKMYNIE